MLCNVLTLGSTVNTNVRCGSFRTQAGPAIQQRERERLGSTASDLLNYAHWALTLKIFLGVRKEGSVFFFGCERRRGGRDGGRGGRGGEEGSFFLEEGRGGGEGVVFFLGGEGGGGRRGGEEGGGGEFFFLFFSFFGGGGERGEWEVRFVFFGGEGRVRGERAV